MQNWNTSEVAEFTCLEDENQNLTPLRGLVLRRYRWASMLSLKTCSFGTLHLHVSRNSTGFQQNLGIYCLRYLWKFLLNHSNVSKQVAAGWSSMMQRILEKRDWGLTSLGKQLQCPCNKLISISPSWSTGDLKTCTAAHAFLVQEFSTCLPLLLSRIF